MRADWVTRTYTSSTCCELNGSLRRNSGSKCRKIQAHHYWLWGCDGSIPTGDRPLGIHVPPAPNDAGLTVGALWKVVPPLVRQPLHYLGFRLWDLEDLGKEASRSTPPIAWNTFQTIETSNPLRVFWYLFGFPTIPYTTIQIELETRFGGSGRMDMYKKAILVG